ncbi:hypothetical protein ColLi_07447 [Colletotrichum liriopes]|uniref:Uncharacterized protein n=1 Tax=Colletotrichum liriopes TaxID=708192 RepID=A0AA37LTT7_9PEZI|nr:hypothetical protein ColLi_07447 [Colletotrichum liriopes]
MSFFEGDTRKGEQPAPPPRALTPVEIGAIIGTITVFIGVVGSLFFYRAHKAKKRREKNGERVDDDEHQLQGAASDKRDNASSREEERRVVRPLPPPPPRSHPPRNKRTWDHYEGPRVDKADGRLRLSEGDVVYADR